MDSGQVQDRFETGSGQVWGFVQDMFGVLSGTISSSGQVQDKFGTSSGQVWDRFRVLFGTILRQLGTNSG